MDRLETRELEYFVAVAEELHFGRAAARLRIAQPALSKAIRRIEHRLGVRLLERGSRQVRLTAAGEILLDEGRRALEAVLAAARHARQAGVPDGRLTLVVKPDGDGGLLPDILTAYEREPGVPAVEVVFGDTVDRASLLRDGRADVALLHTPHEDLRGLDAEPLMVEPRVAVLPEWHRYARRAGLRWADLRDETLPRWHGRAAGGATGPVVADVTQLKQLVVLGRTIGVLARSTLGQLGGELVCVPVLDATPSTLVVAWPSHRCSTPVRAFVRAAMAAASRRYGGAHAGNPSSWTGPTSPGESATRPPTARAAAGRASTEMR
ncbi:MAG TPA: LysR family transcriptional regulator [Pseudonocardiaceae bacterium]|nr:LysR family transcriptional regulator [Pseudonocardiaceae bacterium]